MSDAALADLGLDHPLPVGPVGHKSNGWWGMAFVIMTEASLFAYLLFSYFYIAIQPHQDWPPNGLPDLTLALPDTVLLLASSVVAWWGERNVKRGRTLLGALGLGGAAGMGAVFVGIQLIEWGHRPFTLSSGPYGSIFFVTTGFHMAHVVIGVLILLGVTLWTLLGYFDRVRNAPISIGTLYWHFVDVVWLAVFFTFYLTPYLGCCHV